MPPRLHLTMLVPIVVSGVIGTFCVVAVNSWMNHPIGFQICGAKVTDIDLWAAMFNPLVWLQFLHMWLGAFMLVGLVVSGVYAAGLLRGGGDDAANRLGFIVPFVFGSVASLV